MSFRQVDSSNSRSCGLSFFPSTGTIALLPRLIILATLLLLFVATISWAQEPDRTPEQATAPNQQKLAEAASFMVATANPYASKAAYRILQKGGNAIDATVAATLVLTLVEPQSSGLGGGCFILFWDQQKQKLTTFDGRETAPSAANEDLFLVQGQPLAFRSAVAGGRAVGAPGQLKSLMLAHQQHGQLPWAELFTDSIALAENGFIVSSRLASLLRNQVNRDKLARNPKARAYFYPGGQALAVGNRRSNPELALTLRKLAQSGNSLYRGQLAKDIFKAVQQDQNPGKLTGQDLQRYQAVERQPVCASYGNHRVCGMGPPSSGGISLLQMLKLLEETDIRQQPPGSAEAIHLFAQAGRLAFADRQLYLADADFVSVPTQGLLDPNYLRQRAPLINRQKDSGTAEPGKPPGTGSSSYQTGQTLEQPGTSHLSIVDATGNAVAITASIEQAFGSGIMVGGFLLNNELTDFSFRSKDQDGSLIANRVQGGKRPRSSMAPTMVFDQQKNLKMVLGSPGGSRIIPYVAQTLLGVLDWNLSVQEAINQPHFLHRNGRYLDLEKGTRLEALAPTLEKYGYQVNITDLNSGIQAIVIGDHRLQGGADPRREGLVLGD